MENIDKIVNSILENDKTISLEDIIKLNLTEKEFDYLMEALNVRGIAVSSEEECIEEDYFTDSILKQYLNEIGKIPLLTKEEEKELFKKYKSTNDSEVRKKIVNTNLRLVVSVAKRYRYQSKSLTTNFLDLIQDGNEGLLRAIEKFDPDLGYKFSTYAIWWIRQSMVRAMSDFGRTIRIPNHLLEKAYKIKKYINENMGLDLKEINIEEVAKHFNMEVKDVKDCLYIVEDRLISLDEPIGEKGEACICDYVAAEQPLIEDLIVEQNSNENMLKELEQMLLPREFQVLSLRFGIENQYNEMGKSNTLEEIGKMLGVTRERVRQIENKALRRLRMVLKKPENIGNYKKMK